MMTRNFLLHRAIRSTLPLLAAATLVAPGLAQMPPPSAQQQFAPATDNEPLPTRVGRVSTFGGEIYRAPAERASDWEVVGVNYPVTNGDNLWVAQGGRAEVDFGGGQLRMGSETNVSVAQLDEHNLGLFVAQGRINVRVRVLDAGDTIVIDTPNTQVQLTRPGLYGIDVRDGATMFAIRQGAGQALVASGPQQVYPGQTAIISGTDQTVADIRGSAPVDGFDTWSAERDRYYEQGSGTKYVSREMVGYADLQQYGTWQTQPEYGAVWYPTNVPSGWAPYSDGYWTNTAGFGLTWVDAAPWGYAPFHYGRWAHVNNRWGWLPGTYVARPVWAPALVAWTGGSNWNVGISVGGPVYGWVPLGWREPYRPSWGGCGANCWNRYNQPYRVEVNYNNFYREPPRRPENYANWRVPGAVMAVPGSALGNRVPVSRERLPINAAMLGAAPALREPVNIRPQPVATQVIRPGTRGAPPPASTLYAQSKPAQMGLSPTRPRTAAAPGAPGQPGQFNGGPAAGRGNAPDNPQLNRGPATAQPQQGAAPAQDRSGPGATPPNGQVPGQPGRVPVQQAAPGAPNPVLNNGAPRGAPTQQQGQPPLRLLPNGSVGVNPPRGVDPSQPQGVPRAETQRLETAPGRGAAPQVQPGVQKTDVPVARPPQPVQRNDVQRNELQRTDGQRSDVQRTEMPPVQRVQPQVQQRVQPQVQEVQRPQPQVQPQAPRAAPPVSQPVQRAQPQMQPPQVQQQQQQQQQPPRAPSEQRGGGQQEKHGDSNNGNKNNNKDQSDKDRPPR